MSHQYTDHRNHTIFSKEEAEACFPQQPYIQRVAYSDWTDGHEHLMHCHTDLAEVLLILRGHGRYSIGLHRYDVEAGDVILCNSGEIHDEFPQSDEPYHTLCIGIKNLAMPNLPAGQLIAANKLPIFHKPRQFEDLSALLLMIERHAAEQTPHHQMLCQSLMLAASSQSHLAVTHSKFERTALHKVAELADFDSVVLDAGTGDETVASLREQGANVKVAKTVASPAAQPRQL